MITNIRVTEDHRDEVLKELDERKEIILEIIGMKAEEYAKRGCVVDTGLLRNSITYAVAGHEAKIKQYKDNHGKVTGAYTGTAPGDNDAVYVGSNVEYAPYVEMGTQRMGAQPFLKPAILDHADTFRRIIEAELKK